MQKSIPAKNSQLVKKQAIRLGFLDCGISKARKLEKEAKYLQKWLKQNMNGEMQYMEKHFEKRLDPAKLIEGTKSVISLLYNYHTNKTPGEKDAYKISKYAYGADYHQVIKAKMKSLIEFTGINIRGSNYRIFVDSAPVLEKAWAKQSGLGWIGKNTNLISKQHGSFFFIAEILVNFEMEYDTPVKDYCGKCTKCIDACPTKAIYEPYKMNANKCISYFTIELKKEIPAEFKRKYKNWIFGCDICQDVCPWNSKPKIHKEPAFDPHPDLLKMTQSDWNRLEKEKFNILFKNSAVKRAKFEGLKRNINFLNKP